MGKPTPALSWILPVYRTAEFLPELLQRIEAASSQMGLRGDFEVVVVDDACPEGGGLAADQAAVSRPWIQVLHFEINAGQDAALKAGMGQSRGDWVVMLDADLQDPPEAVLELWLEREGRAVVFADKRGLYSNLPRRITSWMYRRVMTFGFGLPPGAGLFALMTREVASRINGLSDDKVLLLAGFASLDVPMTSVRIRRDRRRRGSSSYTPFMRMVKGVRTVNQAWSLRRKTPHIPENIE